MLAHLHPGANVGRGDVFAMADPIVDHPYWLGAKLLCQQHVLVQAQPCTHTSTEISKALQAPPLLSRGTNDKARIPHVRVLPTLPRLPQQQSTCR